MTTEDLIHRAAILLSFTDEADAAAVLGDSKELSAEEIYLAVKAAAILNKEPEL